jgi:hypothetical protein
MMSKPVAMRQEQARAGGLLEAARAKTQRRKAAKEHCSMFPVRFSSPSLLLCAFASLREISFSCVVCATWHHLIDIMQRPHPRRVHSRLCARRSDTEGGRQDKSAGMKVDRNRLSGTSQPFVSPSELQAVHAAGPRHGELSPCRGGRVRTTPAQARCGDLP